MKTTGPTKLSTRRLLTALRKKSSKSKKAFWKNLGKIISAPRRNRTQVNLSKISYLAGKNKGKILVVPGKVLGYGELREKPHVAALSYSEKARQEINSKGKALSLTDLVEGNEKESNLVLIK